MKLEDVFPLENAGWPALLVNEAGTIISANVCATKLFGAALDGSAPPLSSVLVTENGTSPELFLKQLPRSSVSNSQLKFSINGGETSTFSVSICASQKGGQKFFVLQLFADTAVKNNPSESGLAQKLDCALQLARTVSLDFNNALTSILGYTSLVLSQMDQNNPWRGPLIEVEKSAAKAAEIATDLATFSRQDREARTQSAGNLNSIIERSCNVFRNSEKKKISWTLKLERKLFVAKFDEAKMQQAIVKLLENSIQALNNNGDGIITVQTRNVELAESAQDRELRLAPGAYVCLEVGDNGSGIAPDILPRIFEPFFTTKKREGHRGLGLALVYGIVTNHGGGVAVSSQTDIGTSVRIYMPAETRIVYDSSFMFKDLNGTQTVLIVDDEDLILAMGETILSAYGYKPITANSGQKALEILSKREKPVDLVITDLVMPSMGGRELAERIHQLSPITPILYTSGYVRPAGSGEDQSYLQKPFTSQELLLKVKTALFGNIS